MWKRDEEELALRRPFTIICPFCEDFYPFPEHIEEVYRCRRCGAVFTIAWRSDMEEAVNQLATSFLQGERELKQTSGDDILCQAVVYEDIENIMRMKMDYETHKLFRSFQGFDQDYLQKLVLVWLGTRGRRPYSIDSTIR